MERLHALHIVPTEMLAVEYYTVAATPARFSGTTGGSAPNMPRRAGATAPRDDPLQGSGLRDVDRVDEVAR